MSIPPSEERLTSIEPPNARRNVPNVEAFGHGQQGAAAAARASRLDSLSTVSSEVFESYSAAPNRETTIGVYRP